MNLTDREIAFCKSYIKNNGDLDKIKDDMRIKIATVKTYKNSIFYRLNVHTSAELMKKLLKTNHWKYPDRRYFINNKPVTNGITLKQLEVKYKRSSSFLRIILARGEFNKFRIEGNFLFKNTPEFKNTLNYFIELKAKRYTPHVAS